MDADAEPLIAMGSEAELLQQKLKEPEYGIEEVTDCRSAQMEKESGGRRSYGGELKGEVDDLKEISDKESQESIVEVHREVDDEIHIVEREDEVHEETESKEGSSQNADGQSTNSMEQVDEIEDKLRAMATSITRLVLAFHFFRTY